MNYLQEHSRPWLSENFNWLEKYRVCIIVPYKAKTNILKEQWDQTISTTDIDVAVPITGFSCVFSGPHMPSKWITTFNNANRQQRLKYAQ